jgi:hypothetical protein
VVFALILLGEELLQSLLALSKKRPWCHPMLLSLLAQRLLVLRLLLLQLPVLRPLERRLLAL